MLAAPCAISSWFELCLSPVTPSATVADSSDSIAPSTAMVMAAGSSPFHPCPCRVRGPPEAVALDRESVADRFDEVDSGVASQQVTASVITKMAISEPGIFFSRSGAIGR